MARVTAVPWLSGHRSGWTSLYGCDGQRTQDWYSILEPESLRAWAWGLPFVRPSALVRQRQHPGSPPDITGCPCSMLPPPHFWVLQIEPSSSPLLMGVGPPPPPPLGLLLATLPRPSLKSKLFKQCFLPMASAVGKGREFSKSPYYNKLPHVLV